MGGCGCRGIWGLKPAARSLVNEAGGAGGGWRKPAVNGGPITADAEKPGEPGWKERPIRKKFESPGGPLGAQSAPYGLADVPSAAKLEMRTLWAGRRTVGR